MKPNKTMKGSRTIGAAVAAVLALSLVFASCASLSGGKSSARLEGPLVTASFPKASELSPYAREGLESLSTFKLANGIPVVVRRNDASPVRHLELVIRGGSQSATAKTAGYELLALKTMARGSGKYSYDAIQSLLDETSAAIGAASGLDYSAYSLTALDKYFGRLLPVWADTLVSPSFKAGDFDQVLSEAKLALQNKEKDPWARAGRVMNDEFFAGHPYAPAPEGTKDSLAAATLDSVKAWYASGFSSDRMFIVASGDFDAAALEKELNAALGVIPNRGAGYPGVAPALSGSGKLLKVEHPQSKGIAYVRGDFAAPSARDPDFMATNVAMKMYSDLLFNVVRDKYGAVYTPSAYIRNSASNYGSVVMYKTNMAGKIKGYIDEATDQFLSGEALAVDPTAPAADPKQPRTTIERALPVYKAQYTNEYFEKLQTNAAAADLIAQSIVTTGDCRTWLLDGQRIDAVTADEIKAAAAKYLAGGKITWVVLGSADTLVPVVPADYERIGTK
jgi:zinc protease